VKVRWTDEALRDLDEIATYLAANYPAVAPAFERRLMLVLAWIERWPQSARRSARRPGVRVVPLGRYPYRVFFRIDDDTVVVLHIHHAARAPWDEE